MTRIAILVFLLGCIGERPSTQTQPRPPTTPPAQRVDAAIARWADALEKNHPLDDAIDGDGQFALGYGAVKLAASHVEGGEEAVSTTLGLIMLQALLPGWFGDPTDTFFAKVPSGLKIGPALVAAGLATEQNGSVIAAVPWDQTLGRLLAAQREHHERLRTNKAWTCRATGIEQTLLPSSPPLVRMAQVSQTIFSSWLETVERLWLVRGRCAGGENALFIVTAFLDGRDRVLLATGPR